jgi:hypothetical protein
MHATSSNDGIRATERYNGAAPTSKRLAFLSIGLRRRQRRRKTQRSKADRFRRRPSTLASIQLPNQTCTAPTHKSKSRSNSRPKSRPHRRQHPRQHRRSSASESSWPTGRKDVTPPPLPADNGMSPHLTSPFSMAIETSICPFHHLLFRPQRRHLGARTLAPISTDVEVGCSARAEFGSRGGGSAEGRAGRAGLGAWTSG